ncbi:chymotrypsin-2 [Drosophila rhopaloa]|uniref:Chymotrypsin-2 n=1 Tax=Drosophila rhopaloa TaxID=1041015 RepID=A0A6P4EM85_DRORH|nr:chymotrypsin-2 [Drosophila rhopaloa]
MQCLLLLLLTLTFGQAEERNIYITGKYHHNVVSIRTRKQIRGWGDNHFCAGSILTARWVLTSGCCVSTLPESTPNQASTRKNMRVVVFTRTRLTKPTSKNMFGVDKVVLDEDLDGECSKLALLKLDRPISGQKFAIKLPKQKMNTTWLCSTLGWGRMYFNGPYSNELLQLRSQESPMFTCKADCQSCLCMGSFTGRGNMCQLDMGSPLFCGNFLYGVARRIHMCNDEGFMVFTSIYHKRKFIERVLNSARSQTKSRQALIIIIPMLTLFLMA